MGRHFLSKNKAITCPGRLGTNPKKGNWTNKGGLFVARAEGAVDDYSDCTDTGHCFLTGKCRAKCRKRKNCKFYTTFTNGW
jgi:hypothetical protein